MKNVYFLRMMVAGLVIWLGLSAGGAQAVTTTTYNFGNLLSGDVGVPLAPNFASLVATDNSNGIWTFTLTIDNNLFSTFGSGAYIGRMKFDFTPNPVTTLTSTFISSNVVGVGVTSVSTTSGDCTAGTAVGCFDFGTKFGAGSANRLSQSDYVKWDVSTLAAGSVLTNMYVHVQGITNCTSGNCSAKYTPITSVPEPESFAMLLAGLGLVGFTARRRKNNKFESNSFA
jgi:hypothetical protein